MSNSRPSSPQQQPDDTPSGVVRIVDDEGTQWTYSSIHDVPQEHLRKVAESVVESDMFETPPVRNTGEVIADSMPAVEIPARSEISPLAWIIVAAVFALAALLVAVFIVISS